MALKSLKNKSLIVDLLMVFEKGSILLEGNVSLKSNSVIIDLLLPVKIKSLFIDLLMTSKNKYLRIERKYFVKINLI